jgi:prepilin-type N-terminal cleavage/methylation domain-containing protein
VRVTAVHRGFSLIELLLVITIIGLLAALLIPSLSRAYAKGKRTKCMANLKQIGVAFHTFSHEHGDKFPMQVSTNSGGTLEYTSAASIDLANAFRSFQAISNELGDPKLLVCPADTRIAAETFAALRNDNVSYFVTRSAEYGDSDSIVAGDRNISGEWRSAGKILRIGTESRPAWTHELHEDQGNLLFGDSRVELLTSTGLQRLVGSVRTPPNILLPADTGAGTAIASASRQPNGPNNGNGTSGGNGVPGSGATSASGANSNPKPDPGTQKLFDQLERVFQGNAGSRSANGSPAVVSTPDAPPRVPKEESPLANIVSNRPSVVVVIPVAAPPENPWPAPVGQIATRIGSPSAWWWLLLLLAAVIAMEIVRRRRTRRRTET